jgi:hypothetical protein
MTHNGAMIHANKKYSPRIVGVAMRERKNTKRTIGHICLCASSRTEIKENYSIKAVLRISSSSYMLFSSQESTLNHKYDYILN